MERYLSLVLSVLEFYDLGKFRHLVEIAKEKNNLVIKFETSNGVYMFKEYQKSKNIQKLIETLNLVTNFFGKNPNFPFLICQNKLGVYYVELNNKIYTIDKFVNGDRFWSLASSDRLINLAKVLAELHSKSKIELSEKKVSERLHYLGLIERFFIKSKNLNTPFIENISKKENRTEFDNFLINNLFPLIRNEYLELKGSLNFIKSKKFHSLVHSDLSPNNILFKKDEIVGLIDYELMRYDFAEYEVVFAINTYIDFDFKKGYDLTQIKLFLSTYREIYGNVEISGEEILAYLRHSIIQLLSIFIGEYIKLNYSTSKEKIIKSLYLRLKWISIHKSELGNLVNF